MVILTDYKESVDIGWYQMSSSTDEPDDLVQAGIDEFQNYENQFLKDEDLVRPILMLLYGMSCLTGKSGHAAEPRVRLSRAT